jgi:tRNA(Ile)-lysidine synthase
VRERIVRPLLSCSRGSIRAYLRAIPLAWRDDASNEDTERLRARVRHDLLPALRQINPRFDESLERTLGILRDEDDLLGEMAEAFAIEFAEGGEREVSFDRAMLKTLSLPMRRRTIRTALASRFPETSRLEFDHIEALASGVELEGFAHDLPGGLRAFAEYDRMVVVDAGVTRPGLRSGPLSVPGTTELGGSGRLVATEASPDDVVGTPFSVVVDANVVEEGLAVDVPRKGERMRPLGMEGTRKLSDMLIDAKVPRRERDAFPVVRDGSRVVWLPGVRMSDEFKVVARTDRAVRLTWEPAEPHEWIDAGG